MIYGRSQHRLLAVEEEQAKSEAGGFFFDEAGRDSAASKGDKGEIVQKDFYLNILEAIFTVGTELARDAFFALRKSAAVALTSSLHEVERQELLERTMGKEKVREAQSMSVQESVAAAKAQESQRDPKQWEKEKEAIYKEAEQAAQERVETELAIQKARMDTERQQMAEEAELGQQQVAAEKAKLQALVAEIASRRDALRDQQKKQVDDSAGAFQEQLNAQFAEMEETLKQKEEQAKQDQEKIEQLEEQLKAREVSEAGASATTTASDPEDAEPKPRIRAGRYTPAEWRDLNDDEKDQVTALREELGADAVMEEFSSAAPATTDGVHPILGPVVQDFGYKRIHVLSVGKLGTIPIWKKQRIYRHERATAMVEDKWRSMNLGLPGIICLHEGSDGTLAILDGQHRVGMMILLRNKQRKYLEDNPDDNTFAAIDFDRVMVEVYPSTTTDVDKHAQNLFLEINKAEPVKLIDMPGVASAKDRQIITQAVEKLYEAYPKMFSPSQRCRVPNVNVDNLRNSLFGSGCLKTHKLTTSTKLYNWILEQNEWVGERYKGEDAEVQVNSRAWKKAEENEFYLGLESSWLYN